MSPAEWLNIFGPDEIRGTDHDLLELLQRHAALGTSLPRLYQCCGTEDFLYKEIRLFVKHVVPSGFR